MRRIARVSPGAFSAFVKFRKLAQDRKALPEKRADVYRFAEKICAASDDEGELREGMRAQYGEAGQVEMALAMASANAVPVTRRAPGSAVSCRKLELKV
jgi:hypothetical protein